MYSSIISTQETQDHLEKANFCIFDCSFNLGNPDEKQIEFLDAHLPGASYVHAVKDLSSQHIPGQTGRHPLPEISKIIDTFSRFGIDDKSQVVLYDDLGGAIAARMWWMLRWLGHDAVAIMDGGLPLWKKENRPLSKDKIIPVEKDFKAGMRNNWLSSSEDLQQFENSDEYSILDARNNNRYLGKNETIDPVAGHIPGAISAPFIENLNADGKWKSKTELKQRFEELLQGASPQNTVSYCGSGITACHNILAMFHAGMGDSKLYVGSWSEWIIDAKRKIS